jgi:hypothetical protein
MQWSYSEHSSPSNLHRDPIPSPPGDVGTRFFFAIFCLLKKRKDFYQKQNWQKINP